MDKMKNLMLVVGIVVMTLLAGCSTPGKLVASSSTTVDHEMQGWAVVVVDGKATESQQDRVRAAHMKYLAAEDAAIDSLGTTNWASAKAYLVNNQELLINLIDLFKKEAK